MKDNQTRPRFPGTEASDCRYLTFGSPKHQGDGNHITMLSIKRTKRAAWH